MPFKIIEMSSLDGLPSRCSSPLTWSSTVKINDCRPVPAENGGSSATASDEVSVRTVVTVSAVLGILFIASIIFTAVTFAETKAKDSLLSNNQSESDIEYIQFAPNNTMEEPMDEAMDDDHETIVPHGASTPFSSPDSGNVTSSLGSLLEAMAGGGIEETAVQQA